MKHLITSIFILFICCGCIITPRSNNGHEHSISALYQVQTLSEQSMDSLFWAIAMKGLDVVPDLIDMVDDTTAVDINIPDWGKFSRIGNISYAILERIIPVLDDDGFFWYYDICELECLKMGLHSWFTKNKENLVWVVDTTNFGRKFEDWGTETYYLPTRGYYMLPFEATQYEHHRTEDTAENLSILHRINDMTRNPENSEDSLFWVLVKRGIEIVPDLIDIIDDATETDIPFGGWPYNYTIGDIAHSVLWKIIPGLPRARIIRNKKDFPRDERHGFYFPVFERLDVENRTYLKTGLHSWFIENQQNFAWVADTSRYTGGSYEDWRQYRYPAKGYYVLEDTNFVDYRQFRQQFCSRCR